MGRKVQMIVTMSGSRPDGRPWPAAGYLLDVEDWEAEHLVRGAMAVPHHEPPPPEPEPEPWVPMASTPAPDQFQMVPPDVPGPEVVMEPEQTPLSERRAPKPVHPKADWVAWAVKSGAAEEDVRELTKAELMERYGERA